MTKITEDNCVLDSMDLFNLEDMCEIFEKANIPDKIYYKTLFQKITKLNEIVKTMKTREKIDYAMHECTGEPPF